MPKERFSKVEVEWIDAFTMGGWRNERSYRDESSLITIKTAGYMLANTKGHVTIVQSYNDQKDGNITDSITIPKAVIRKITTLVSKEK